MFLLRFTLLIGLLSLYSCSKQAEPIKYGFDQCVFCKMNIVDKAHSAQYVSTKGRQFKYDAIECLVRDFHRGEVMQTAMTLVANYAEPGMMIPAETASYIISEQIKSPMGANLSAVPDEPAARKLTDEFGGQIFDWITLQEELTGKK